MTDRRALLIGVPRCDDSTFSDIVDVVRADVRSIGAVLDLSAYSIDSIGVEEDSPEPTGSRIRRKIKKACADAPPGSVLLLYFSGHGVSVDGRDYLVPSDAYREPGALVPDLDSMVPAIPSDLSNCQAKLVVFFVDACRDAPAVSRADGPRGGVVHYPAGGSLVMVAGCAPGQICHYGQAGSTFTQTLARVLDRNHPFRTLSAVLAEVKREMIRKAGRTEDRRQVPDAYPEAMLRLAGEMEICDGDKLTAAWRRAAEDCELWDLCSEDKESARDEVRELAEGCARRFSEVAEALHQKTGMTDPWFDQNYPARVVQRVSLLFGGQVRLSAAETSVLVAAPFLSEVVYAEGLLVAAGLEPGDFKRSYRPGERTDLEITHEMYPQVVRRAEGLDRRNQADSRDALTMWLVHRWLTSQLPIWHSEAASQAYRKGENLITGQARRMSSRERLRLIEAAVRAVGAGPVDTYLEERLRAAHLPDAWRRNISALWLAGILAADPRRMSSVIADHIGTGLELPLSVVRNDAARLEAQVHERRLDLHLVCEHPAQQAAFAELAEAARAVLECISGLGIASGSFPEQISDSDIRPDRSGPDESPAYQTPLSRFRLSEDKVRELLMGRQLYDDPSLAIRELYQNALDACRYRDTRLKGLRRENKNPPTWDGLISFRQGFEGGREYIECEDNGIGMSQEILEHVFSSAGERFVYRQDYRAEHAKWQTLAPPLRMVPNSQFGVGVFSYFMISDEILLITRPVDPHGIPAREGYTVRIASSGSLFQVTPSEEMLGGGTRVRLYLTGDEDEKISVLQTMRHLLWIAEYKVQVSEHDSAQEEWKPGILRYQDESAESLEYDRDLWWVSGDGGLAADGIRTNEEIFGLIADLRDVHRPQFTVDRKKLRTWDKAWVNEKIDASLPRLMDWAGLSLSWLWEVAKSNPEVAQRIFTHLLNNDKVIPVGGTWGQNAKVSIAEVGCLPDDERLFDPKEKFRYYGNWFASWRSGVWSKNVKPRSLKSDIPSAVAVAGFPVVDAIDGALLGRLGRFGSNRRVPVDAILEAITHPEHRASDLLRRLRKFAVTGLNLAELRRCPSLPVTFKDEDAPIIRALAAWSPAGLPRPAVIAGWLVKASSELDQPLGEVFRRASAIAPEDWIPPALELGALADYICTVADTKLVSRDLDGEPPWVQEGLSPRHIAHAIAELGRDIDQILIMCERLSPLGVTVASRDLYPSSCEGIEVEALRHLNTTGEALTPMQLVSIAGFTGLSVHDAWSNLRRMEECGMLRLPDISRLKDLAPDGAMLELIERQMTSTRYATGRVEFLPRKACLVITKSICGRFSMTKVRGHALALAPFAEPSSEITNPDLVSLAVDSFCTIGEARRFLQSTYPDAKLPPEDVSCSDLYPWGIGYALVGSTYGWRKTDWLVGPGEIIFVATLNGMSIGEFVEHLAPYRKLGAPVPELTPETLENFMSLFPDEYDVEMLRNLEADDESQDFLAEIDALHLVKIAGRLGMTTADVHRRLVKLAPLGIRLDYPAGACNDEIIRWQDLLLLTVFLDGSLPCVGGTVGMDHLQKAAQEIGKPVDWLIGRIRLYAPLFSLALSMESDIE